jgi:uncharacterized caspase-like protein
MKILVLISSLIASLLLSSCATIFFGTRQKVKFETEPAGAMVIVNGKPTNKVTPCEIKIPRKQPLSIDLRRMVTYELRKENYNYVEFMDYSSKSVLVGFFSWYPLVIPGVVDLITGANNRYTKSHSLALQPLTSSIVYKTDTIVKQEIVYVESSIAKPKYIFERKSDVDNEIPSIAKENPRRFALIIGNEDYSSHQIDLSTEVDVLFARNDASAFKEYALKLMGVPERNITLLLDATTGQMRQAINRISALIRSTYGEAEVVVYYAGHGLPDEISREPYLMPVDVSGKNATDGVRLYEMYQKLTEHPSKRVTVFIDACFSGGARNQGLVAARGVRVKPKESPLSGNLVVFTASSCDQSSLPHPEQHHGFFTYYLLKLLKEKGSSVSYAEIADYMKKHIEVESILINDKEQTPQIILSPTIGDEWTNWNFK